MDILSIILLCAVITSNVVFMMVLVWKNHDIEFLKDKNKNLEKKVNILIKSNNELRDILTNKNKSIKTNKTPNNPVKKINIEYDMVEKVKKIYTLYKESNNDGEKESAKSRLKEMAARHNMAVMDFIHECLSR